MSIKDGYLKTVSGVNIDLSSIRFAEIHVYKKYDVIVRCEIVARAKWPEATVPFVDDINISDKQILEDYFIDNNTDYYIINEPA